MKKKLLIVFLIIVLIVFGLRKISASFFSTNACRCIQTGVLSDDYFGAIKTNVNQLVDKKYSAQTIITYLKKEFPALDKITVVYRPCGTYVMVYACKPICCINDSLVLSSSNHLYDKEIFTENSRDIIPHITIAQECVSKISSIIPSLLQELPTDFNEKYQLELFNEHCVRLIDKQEKKFSIVSYAAQKKLSSLLAECDLVKKNISEQRGFDKGINWAADIRFADYIVAYKV